MDLTAENLVEALAVSSGERYEDIGEIVQVARKESGFLATLLSAWQAEGIELSLALRAELETISRRTDFYRSLAARLFAEVPGLSTIKGLEVAALYPPGLVRYMNDLDVIAPSEPDLWRAVRLLTDEGWDLHTATFSYLGGTLRVMVSVRMPNEDRFQLPYGVELATYYTLGNQGGIPPIITMPAQWRSPAVKNTIMLLHERYEQRYRARDLVDAALLHRSMGPADRGALHDAVVALGLAIEYAELVRLVNAAGLEPLPELPGGRLITARARATRLSRGASFFARPVSGTGRHMQRRLIQGKPSRAETAAWERVERRLHPVTAVKAGLLAFGLPIGGPRTDVTTAVLRRRGEFGWVDTPAGRFLLTIGDYISESAVDELADDADAGDQDAAGSDAAGSDAAGRESPEPGR